MNHYKDQPPRPGIMQLVLPYWLGANRWKAFSILAVLLCIMFGSVYMHVWANRLAGDVTDALLSLKWEALRPVLLASIAVGIGVGSIAVINEALKNVMEVGWRTTLTNKLLGEWFSYHAYYDIEREGALGNADQRIAEDVRLFVDQTVTLSLSFVHVIVNIVTFTVVLWGLSGSLSLKPIGLDVEIPGYMVYVAFAYNIGSLALIHWVGKRMIGLNMERQGTEADYRFDAMQVRTNAEQIAFYRGEGYEKQRLLHRFQKVRENFYALILRQAKVSMTSTVYSHLFSPLPILVALPRYLAGEITMGGITRITGAYGSLNASLHFFSQAYVNFTNWLAVANRVRDLQWAINKARLRVSGFSVQRTDSEVLRTGALVLLDPLERPLSELAPLQIAPGERWIIRGPSGAGKSTLLRALAGLWPYGSGDISIPANAKMMFLPQHSYLPTGSFKSTLCYPEPAKAFDDEACWKVLRSCGLGQRIESLGTFDNWQQQLSGGEQQRVAFARVLLHRPDFIFLDEATSALDPDSEARLYTLLINTLPEATIVSVAHRTALAKYHDHTLELAASASNRTEDAVSVL